jgi:hypothetical protein
MFLKSKEALLLNQFSLQESFDLDLEKELTRLLERLELDPQEYFSSSVLNESRFFTAISEMSEEEAADKLSKLKEEVTKNRETVIKKKNTSKAMAWWVAGLALVLVGAFLVGVGILAIIASIILAIVKLLETAKGIKVKERLKSSIPKLKRLYDNCNSKKAKAKINELIDRIKSE